MDHVDDMTETGIAAADAAEGGGIVVTYWNDEHQPAEGHERCTLAAVARALARIKAYRFGGVYDPRNRYEGHLYFVPKDTLVAADATHLPIADEGDLFGGMVRYPFVATKTITHPLLDDAARSPEGWCGRFPERVREDVLDGYAAFSIEDARRAAVELLRRGPVRLKLASGIGGSGQSTAADHAELDAALQGLDSETVLRHGMVVEQDLSAVTTFSVGQVQVDDLCVSYHGTQRLTENNSGEQVYGGSEVTLVRGGFDALLATGLEPPVATAVRQAMRYDVAARAEFAGFFASRRNYDVARGLDAAGRERSGVLEQSWRSGGATPAELTALQAFNADRALTKVRAASIEVYGECELPPGATVIFRGNDPKLGALTKYSVLEHDGLVS